MKHGQSLIAKQAFGFKVPGARGRGVTVKVGDKFWVTNCGTDQKRSGLILIDREGKGYISHGYAFAPETLATYFQEA